MGPMGQMGMPLLGMAPFPSNMLQPSPFGFFTPQQLAMIQANQMLLSIKQNHQSMLNNGTGQANMNMNMNPLLNTNMNMNMQMPTQNAGLQMMNMLNMPQQNQNFLGMNMAQ